MGVSWRLVRACYADSAFSGEGARLFGGRWNSPGVPIVYTSAHLSLASLETMVHLQPLTPRDRFVVFRVEWKDRFLETIEEKDLPKQWTAEPPGMPTMRIGDLWFREGRSAVLAVPSMLVPEEKNYLLNPRHPDYSEIKVTETRDYFFDTRLQF